MACLAGCSGPAPGPTDEGAPALIGPTPDPRSGESDAVLRVVGERRWAEAARHQAGSGIAPEALAARYAGWRKYRVQVTGPPTTEGAAGSIYAKVPVRRSGRLTDGRAWSDTGDVVLRRVNDVPRTSAAQLQWRVTSGEPRSSPAR